MQGVRGCTKNFQPEGRLRVPLKFAWITAETVAMRSLKNYLCELGEITNGNACKNCVSSCAYGKRYLLLTERVPIKRERKKLLPNRMCQAVNDDGEIVGQWRTISRAAPEIGGTQYGISRSINCGMRHRGLRFSWVEREAGKFRVFRFM